MKRRNVSVAIAAAWLGATSLFGDFSPGPGYTLEKRASSAGTFTLIEGLYLDSPFLYYGQGTSVRRLNLNTLDDNLAGTLPANVSVGGVSLAAGRLVAGFGTSFSFPFPGRIGYLDAQGVFVDQGGTDGLYDMAVDPVSGHLYVVANPGAAGTKVFRYNPLNGQWTEIIDVGSFSGGLTFDPRGRLFVAQQSPARVLRFDPPQLAAGGLTAADGAMVADSQISYMTTDNRGRLYAVRGFGNELVMFDPDSGRELRQVAVDDSFGFGIGKLAWDPWVNALYVTYADFSVFSSVIWEVVAPPVKNDFDRDGWSDVAMYNPWTGAWIHQHADESFGLFTFSGRGGAPVAGDFDGDSFADPAVYHARTGTWRIFLSSTGEEVAFQWGWRAAEPVPGDYDGDGITDLAVVHRAAGDWYILRSSDGQIIKQNWGWREAVPVPGDYDGDGRTDLAVVHPANGDWYILRSSDGVMVKRTWGWSAAEPVPGDYDGDGLTDLAVYHPSSATWYLLPSDGSGGQTRSFGPRNAIPVPADYDGDGIDDLAVYQRGRGVWSIHGSLLGDMRRELGGRGDVPVR